MPLPATLRPAQLSRLPRQPPFPGQRVGDDGIEIVELRPPVERRVDARHIGDQRGRITGAAAGNLDGKFAPAGAAHRLDHLEYRMAVAVAAVERGARAAAAQMRERRKMRAREIADVDVVADAGSVGCRIVGAEDVELRAAAERGLAGDLDQMRRAPASTGRCAVSGRRRRR